MSADKKRTTAEVLKWMCEQIGERIAVDPSEIDPTQPFATFGIGSRDAVGLIAELGDWLGRPLKPTLLFDYPTVELLAEGLTEGGA